MKAKIAQPVSRFELGLDSSMDTLKGVRYRERIYRFAWPTYLLIKPCTVRIHGGE